MTLHPRGVSQMIWIRVVHCPFVVRYRTTNVSEPPFDTSGRTAWVIRPSAIRTAVIKTSRLEQQPRVEHHLRIDLARRKSDCHALIGRAVDAQRFTSEAQPLERAPIQR